MLMGTRSRMDRQAGLLAWLAAQEREELWNDLALEAREALVRELTRLMVEVVEQEAAHEPGGASDPSTAP